ncbi:MAG TPA: c-type cytochrome [Verrucomicrobiae bacterium]|nr:c-type cytochrome [Verrucomicrobiae bacterium]
MNRKAQFILGTLAVAVICTLIVSVLRAQPNGVAPGQQPGEKTAEQQFKNIQVLKGIPADELIPSMQFITASLGVECDFCHVQGAFDKDDKKTKQTARKMMEMMFAINADNFDRNREVTCYTCHRGNSKPVSMPPVMTAEMMANMMANPPETTAGSNPQESGGPTAAQLFDKYVQASGGAAAIDKITSRVMKGTISFGAHSWPIDIYSKEPDERISFTHLPEGDNITAFNGHEGWLGPMGRIHDMHGGELDGAAIDADLHLATHLQGMFSQMKVTGPEKIGDHQTYEVLGEREGKTPIELYFDEQSGLLVRMVRYNESALGRLPTQIDYADYRDADGVKIPYQWTLARPGGRFTIQVSEVQQNVPVDDAKFVKPAPPEPPKTK